MTPILHKLINDILPVSKRVNYINYVPSDKLPSEVMDECIKGVFRRGWLDMKSVQTLEYLLNLCGSDWFCDRCIEVSCNPTWLTNVYSSNPRNFLFIVEVTTVLYLFS